MRINEYKNIPSCCVLPVWLYQHILNAGALDDEVKAYQTSYNQASIQQRPPMYHHPQHLRHSPTPENAKFLTTDQLSRKKQRNSRGVSRGFYGETDYTGINRDSRAPGGEYATYNEPWLMGQYQHFEDYVVPIHYDQNTHSEDTSPVTDDNVRSRYGVVDYPMSNGSGDTENAMISRGRRYNRDNKSSRYNDPTTAARYSINNRLDFRDNNCGGDTEAECLSKVSGSAVQQASKCSEMLQKTRLDPDLCPLSNAEREHRSPYAASEPDNLSTSHLGRLAADGGWLIEGVGGNAVTSVLPNQRCFSDSDGMFGNELINFYAMPPPSPAPPNDGDENQIGSLYEKKVSLKSQKLEK